MSLPLSCDQQKQANAYLNQEILCSGVAYDRMILSFLNIRRILKNNETEIKEQ